MERAEVEFDSIEDEKKFVEKCMEPKFVIECLKKYQRWRKGIGEYDWRDPEERRPIPFCGRALSIIEDHAIEMLQTLYCTGGANVSS